MSRTFEDVIELNQRELLDFCGKNDQRLRELEGQLGIRIVPRGTTLKLMGSADEVARAREAIEKLLSIARGDRNLSRQQMSYVVESVKSDRREDLESIFTDRVSVPLRKRGVTPMTAGQKRYLDAIRRSDIVFGIGPAGTGKTYLAMAMAVNYLVSNLVRRIILVRPAVEAGEKLGFLPGDIAAKFDPYVRPLYDALHDMVDPDRVKQYLETGIVEVAPLAFMRGRTLNSSFVILDEAQNTSVEQMKMFLTRLGFDSKAVITGDVTQIDLPAGKESGLVHVQSVLSRISGIDFIHFEQSDVVRHALVQKIVKAYEAADARARGAMQQELTFEGGGAEPGGGAGSAEAIRLDSDENGRQARIAASGH
ncbi:MAG: PhoH family protein [Candidatus Sumerlaeaceae bacterium]|nr:PhoH family protein [Candidatus Sumerlaeaceae bacterium]